MTAEENGDPLPFSVTPANVATIRTAERRFKDDESRWLFIDRPPNGRVMNEAADRSDLVIAPTTTGPADIVKTFETPQDPQGARHSLPNPAHTIIPNTFSLKQSIDELEEHNASCFDVQVTSRKA